MRLREMTTVLVAAVFVQSSVLWATGETDGSQGGTPPQERYSDIDRAKPATGEGKMTIDLGGYSMTRHRKLDPLKVNDTELLMKPHAGGKFGLFSDWRDSVAIPGLEDDEPQLRGGVCQTDEMKERVRVILERRSKTPDDSKVAACIRSKDYGRFLPEWVAFHYALGVDEVKIFDDESVDRTAQALSPFIDAGIVKYQLGKIIFKMQMKPLNDCLKHYIDKRNSDKNAPRWILFHDSDEYIFPVNTNLSLPEALGVHNNRCCALVPRVQYGSGNRIETPRGLVIENFLTHANPANTVANRLPKVMVNLDPSKPEEGVLDPRLPSMHNAHGCTCANAKMTEIRINHYLGSRGDFYDHTRLYWEERRENQPAVLKLSNRDINDETSDTITHWACATREILYRVVNSLDLETGL